MNTRATNSNRFILPLAAGLALAAPLAGAQTIAVESFDYEPSASITSRAGGVGWAGPWQSAGYGDWAADAAGAVYARDGAVLASSGKRAVSASGGIQRVLSGAPIGAPGTQLWVSFIARQTQGAAAGSWLGLKLPCTGPNPFLFLGKSYGNAQWGADAGLPGSTRLTSTAVSTRALIVAKIDFREGADDVAVWINPGTGNEYFATVSPDLALAEYGDFSGITKAVLETGSLAAPVRGVIDELRLGRTAADVTPTRPGVVSGGARVIPEGQARAERRPDGSVRVSDLNASAQGRVAFDLNGFDGHGYAMDAHEFLTTPGAVIRETISDSAGAALFSSEFASSGDGYFQLATVLPGSGGTLTVGGTNGQVQQLPFDLNMVLQSSIPCSFSQHAVIHKIWGREEVGYFYLDPITLEMRWVHTGWRGYVKYEWRTCEPNLLVADGRSIPISWAVFESDVLDERPDGIGGATYSLAETEGLGELLFWDMGGLALGQEAHAMGDALITGGCPGGGDGCDFSDRVLTIDNFGGSGDDGVSFQTNGATRVEAVIDLGSSMRAASPVDPGSELRIRHHVRNSAGEIRDIVSLMGRGADDSMQVRLDATEIGASRVSVRIGLDGQDVGGLEGDVSEILCSINWQWEEDMAKLHESDIFAWGWAMQMWMLQQGTIVVSSGGETRTFVGDSVTMTLLDGEQAQSIEGFDITGRDLVGPIAISGVRTTTAVQPSCPADFNGDGFLDFFDYDEFVQAFEAGTPAADFNSDGFVDFFDFDGYIAAFEAGC